FVGDLQSMTVSLDGLCDRAKIMKHLSPQAGERADVAAVRGKSKAAVDQLHGAARAVRGGLGKRRLEVGARRARVLGAVQVLGADRIPDSKPLRRLAMQLPSSRPEQ